MGRRAILLALAAVAALSVWVGAAAAQRVVPLDVEQTYAGLYGDGAWVPTWVPPGYRYAGNTPFGTIEIDFTRKGKFLEWTVLNEPPATRGCGEGLASQHKRYGSHTVYYGKTKGRTKQQSAWMCLDEDGNLFELTAVDQGLATPLELMKMVGTSRKAID